MALDILKLGAQFDTTFYEEEEQDLESAIQTIHANNDSELVSSEKSLDEIDDCIDWNDI